MSKKHSIYKAFSENLKRTFERFRLSIKDSEGEVVDNSYLCPISLLYFPIESIKAGYLTIEHVPPRSLGGKGLLLISKEVNNRDGYTSDKKMLKYFEGENFNNHKGTTSVKLSSESLDFRGITAEFSLVKDQKHKVLFETSTQNFKALEHNQLFENWDNTSFTVSGSIVKELDKKALLKCAYLLAFHKIGYELIFNAKGLKKDTYGVIINYLKDDESKNTFNVIYRDGHAPLTDSIIGQIISPIEYKCIFVNITFILNKHSYKYVVFLPHPEDNSLKNLQNLNHLMTNNGKIKEINFQILPINN